MKMQETESSLSKYFIIIGFLSLIISGYGLYGGGIDIISSIYSILYILLAIGFIYVGFNFRRLLNNNVIAILRLLYVNISIIGVSCIYELMNGGGRSIIALLINIYVIYNVNRLKNAIPTE